MSRPTGNFARAQEQRERRHRTQPRRGLSAVEAATYIGIAPHKFDALVRKRILPLPRLIDGTQSWDIDELDEAYETFPHKLAETSRCGGLNRPGTRANVGIGPLGARK
jgi:hypothetical protein